MFTSPNFGVIVEVEGADVIFQGREVDPSTGDFFLWRRLETTIHHRVIPTALNGSDFFILGQSQSGDLVVERWAWPRVLGAYFADFDTSLNPIGTPTRTGDTSIEIEGGVFVEPRYRAPRPVVSRSVVLTASGIGTVLSASVDPDGRFILLQRQLTNGMLIVSQLPLHPTGAIVDLVSSQYWASLGSGRAQIYSGDFGRQGRIHTVRLGGEVAVLSDPNNDGIIDTPVIMDAWDFDDAYPAHGWNRIW